MGYGIVPNYKDEDVVCQHECSHTDCAALREDFVSNNKCRICGEELKVGDSFYYDGVDSQYGKYSKVHTGCV